MRLAAAVAIAVCAVLVAGSAVAADSDAFSDGVAAVLPNPALESKLPLFNPISTAPPPDLFQRVVHPLYIRNVDPSPAVLQTNKFWDNFLFPPPPPPTTDPYHDPATLCYQCRGSPVHAHPYVLAANPNMPYGLSVSHASEADVLYGADASPSLNELDRRPPTRVKFYTNTLINNWAFSANEFAGGVAPSLQVIASDVLSATVRLSAPATSITFPIVRGMAFVTATYSRATPLFYTQNPITSFTIDSSFHNTSADTVDTKYRIKLNNDQTWLMYLLRPASGAPVPTFTVKVDIEHGGGWRIEADRFMGEPFTIRLALLPSAATSDARTRAVAEQLYDRTYGTVVTGAELEAHPFVYNSAPYATTTEPLQSAPLTAHRKSNDSAGAASTPVVTIPDNVFNIHDPNRYNTVHNTIIYSFVFRTESRSVYVPADTTAAAVDGNVLHFAFAHQTDILSRAQTVTELSLRSTTKGMMTAVLGARWDLVENGLSTVSWLPPRAPDADKLDRIRQQLATDVKHIRTDVRTILNSGSNYWVGKALAKVAMLCLVSDDLKEHALTANCVDNLTDMFDAFINHTATASASSPASSSLLTSTILMSEEKQAKRARAKAKAEKERLKHAPLIDPANINRLVYDVTWKGIVGERGLVKGNENADFGSSYYNDHHYHYGYWVHAAAILRKLRPEWGRGRGGDFINSLIRDVANPSLDDTYFPRFRSFDWFAGHSWSKGLFDCHDGKDQESTSEEVNFHYGLMLWGMASDRSDVATLANLMFAVARRSINRYFLMDDHNDVQPANFIGNRVTGIYFENKVAYTTWFSVAPEHIHGIQMIPILPVSELVRYSNFIELEWELIWDTAAVVSDGWKSVLYANYAAIEKNTAYDALLTAPMFDGLTRTWALFWAATRPFPGTVVPPGQLPTANAGNATAHVHTAKIIFILLAAVAAFALMAYAVSYFWKRQQPVSARRPDRAEYEVVRQLSDYDLGRTPSHAAVAAMQRQTSTGTNSSIAIDGSVGAAATATTSSYGSVTVTTAKVDA